MIGGQKYNEPTNVGFSKAAVAQRLCRLNSLLYLGCGILENWTHKYLLMPLPIPSQIHFLTNFQPVPLLTDSKDFTNYHLLYLPLLTMVTLEHSQDIKARIEHFTANGVTSAEAGSKANGTEMSSATADFSPSGMRCDIKNLYQGEADRRGRFTWVDKYPENLEEAAENAETARYALLIRNNKCFDGRKKLEIDSIVVQSPLLKAILGSVLKDYPGVTTGLDRLTFAAPFQPFVHRWERLVHAKEAEGDTETKQHLDLLFTTLEAELKDTIKAKNDLVSHNVITFEHIWTIFEPCDFVFTTQGVTECALQLQSADYGNTMCGRVYALNCEKVDWDGENFGRGRDNLKIFEFSGTLPISQLAAYPLKYHSDEATLKERLIERGRLFERLQGFHYKAFKGIAIGYGQFGPIKYNVSRFHLARD